MFRVMQHEETIDGMKAAGGATKLLCGQGQETLAVPPALERATVCGQLAISEIEVNEIQVRPSEDEHKIDGSQGERPLRREWQGAESVLFEGRRQRPLQEG